MKALLLIVLSLSTLNLFAEGPPISADGKIIGPYRAFVLNDQQKQTLRFSRVLTLSEQQAKKEGIKDPQRRLFLLTSNYNDCTCGLTYGIWFHPDSVAVFGEEYPVFDTLAEGQRMPGRALLAISYQQSEEHALRSLYISATGTLYYQHRAVSTELDSLYVLFDAVSAAVDSAKKASPDFDSENPDNYLADPITLYIPPLLGNRHREKVLHTFYRLHLLQKQHLQLSLFYQ